MACQLHRVLSDYCILYQQRMEKQQGERDQMGRPNWSSKAREQFQAIKAQAICGKLSKAKVDLESIRSNGKLKKKERGIEHS